MQNESGTSPNCDEVGHSWSQLAASRKRANKKLCSRCGRMATRINGDWEIDPLRR